MQPDKKNQPADPQIAKAPVKPAKKSGTKSKTVTKPSSNPTEKATIATTATSKVAAKTVAKKPTKSAVKAKSVTDKPVKRTSTKQPLQLTFQVAFSTKFGQVIKVGGNHPALGDDSDEKALELNFADLAHWFGQANIDKSTLPADGLQYYYLILHADGTIDKSAHYFLDPATVPAKATRIFLQDAWNSPAFMENAFSTDVFKTLIKTPGKKSANTKKSKVATGTHLFSVKAPQLANQQVICLIGDHAQIGGWDTNKAVLLLPDGQSNTWQISLPLKPSGEPIHYKYGIYDTAASQFIAFESGDNRILNKDQPVVDQVQIHDGFVRTN